MKWNQQEAFCEFVHYNYIIDWYLYDGTVTIMQHMHTIYSIHFIMHLLIFSIFALVFYTEVLYLCVSVDSYPGLRRCSMTGSWLVVVLGNHRRRSLITHDYSYTNNVNEMMYAEVNSVDVNRANTPAAAGKRRVKRLTSLISSSPLHITVWNRSQQIVKAGMNQRKVRLAFDLVSWSLTSSACVELCLLLSDAYPLAMQDLLCMNNDFPPRAHCLVRW